MASKRDLVEAQGFSRRRLLTAFVSGAPGGQELEPTKPLRAVVAGIGLTVLLVAGSLAFGLLSPTLPSGWDDGSLVVVKGDGSRYVGIKGTLHPVLNTTSARLAVPSSSFHVVDVSADDITGSPRGATIGIPGAPDALPPRDRLVATGWLACLAPDGRTRTLIGTQDALAAAVPAAGATAGAAAQAPGVLVDVAGDEYVVTGGLRYRIGVQDQAAVLRAFGLDTATPRPATAAWVDLFPAGTDLAPLTVPGAGRQVPSGSGLPLDTVVGTSVTVTGSGEATRHYVVDDKGDLAPISDFAAPLYALGSGASAPQQKVAAADVADVRTSSRSVGPADWPQEVPTAPADAAAACGRLTTGSAPTASTAQSGSTGATDGTEHVDLLTPTLDRGVAAGTDVAPGTGALVRAQTSDGAAGQVLLVDESGTAFPVPDPSDEVLARLGYTSKDVTRIPPAWAALLPTGPELTTDGATAQVRAAGGS